MRHRSTRYSSTASKHIVLGAILVLLLTACGSDTDSEPDSDGGSATTTAATSTGAAPTTNAGGSGNTDGSGDDPSDNTGDDIVLEGGSATLTIAGDTFEFDLFLCAFGYEATEQFQATLQDGMVFASAGTGTASDGTPAQIAVQLYDAGIREGMRQVQLLTMGDSGDFEYVWTLSDIEPLEVEDATGRAVVVLDGDNLTIEGGAYDRVADGAETGETAQGSLKATCSPNSLR